MVQVKAYFNFKEKCFSFPILLSNLGWGAYNVSYNNFHMHLLTSMKLINNACFILHEKMWVALHYDYWNSIINPPKYTNKYTFSYCSDFLKSCSLSLFYLLELIFIFLLVILYFNKKFNEVFLLYLSLITNFNFYLFF